MQKGALATAVVVDGTPYTYTGMKIDHGLVEQIEMYPYIPIPTHVGVTVFSSPVYNYFTKLFDLTKKVDFESVLFPLLAEERRLLEEAAAQEGGTPPAWLFEKVWEQAWAAEQTNAARYRDNRLGTADFLHYKSRLACVKGKNASQ